MCEILAKFFIHFKAQLLAFCMEHNIFTKMKNKDTGFLLLKRLTLKL